MVSARTPRGIAIDLVSTAIASSAQRTAQEAKPLSIDPLASS
jgi:hypothetical protein